MQLDFMPSIKENSSEAFDKSEDVLKVLTSFHQSQMDICKRLEQLADDLPAAFDKVQALHIIRHMVPLLKRAHHFEENHVFTRFAGRNLPFCASEKSLERMKFEHWEDELYAEDLAETLHDYMHNKTKETASKLSYMLRGFFDNLRRHIAFEQEFVVPLLLSDLKEVKKTH